MSFDSPTRARLARFVTEARKLLASEFTEKFQRVYGISPSGEVAPVETLPDLDDTQRATAQLLRERLAHLIAANPSDRDAAAVAVARLSREQAFTILNRLAAVRMAEKRGLIVESVGRAYESAGFRVYCQVAGSALGDSYHRYRRYLFCLFDELAVDLGVLFNRRSPFGLLFPRESCLLKLLDLLNAPDLDALWAEDETIGWIYQYYNDEAERKKMREESSAPRNSRELAVRNQFFTPRYVVEFLTDNTLGRLWYEVTQGNTRLKDQCRYLVRRPTEIFFTPGENPPAAPCPSPAGAGEGGRRPGEGCGDKPLPGGAGRGEMGAALSQEELLRQPVHIPHRPLKDPRQIRLLDPACGSMHFGLYAFDLYEVIYAEAWDIAKSGSVPPGADKSFSDFCLLTSEFSTKEAFLREVPRLIIEHNIHGIDIDPRAVQIAGLSLWLRAQRAWHQAGVKPADRPRITRSNLVCAEPMPGEKHLLKDFVEEEFPAQERAIFLKFLEAIFDKMQLAGEAGSLLKIEEEIRTAIEEARQAWEKLQSRPAELFSTSELNAVSRQQELTSDLRPLTSESALRPLTSDFWTTAESRLLEALRDYAEKAEAVGGFQRRLFADDAAQGFAFIDLCRKRYDVVVMNPPFGETSASVLALLETNYPLWNSNLLCAFIGRAQKLLNQAGSFGAIFDKTALVKSSYEKFREAHLFSHYRPSALVDLGWGVLDTAQVETNVATWTEGYKGEAWMGKVGGASSNRNAEFLLAECECMQLGKAGTRTRTISIECIRTFPNQSVPFDAKDWLIDLVARSTPFELAVGKAMVGCQIKADVNFRVFWELPAAESIGVGNTWSSMFNGGEFSPFATPIRDVVRFGNLGDAVPFHKSNHLTNLSWQQKPGFGWGKRGDFVDTQVMPAGCVFTIEGQALPSPEKRLWPLSLLNSRLFWYLMNVFCGQHKYAGYVNVCPVPTVSDETIAVLEQMAAQICGLIRPQFTSDETTREFVSLDRLADFDSFEELLLSRCEARRQLSDEIEQTYRDLNQEVYRWFDVGEAGIADSEAFSANAPTITASLQLLLPKVEAGRSFADETISYALGCIFGCWDIRYATGERPVPELPDPFAPLPVCPPGMLQGDDGLPLTKEEGRRMKEVGKYPLDVAWDGILVDDAGHPLDIVQRVQAALTTIWGDRADALEHEACALLGVPTLREWFRRPAGFFADHLKRYSKSRRQAPIYWPLSTASGSYTLWVYYHRLGDQTLHQVLADFVDPKIKSVERDIEALRERAGGGGSQAGELQELLDELRDFRAEIERAIKLPWQPNLNDGVLITACPLWKLFRLPKWRKDLETCWKELDRGDYDWAHIAYSMWPQRVKEKCKTDRSLAIAHGLEALCEAPPPAPKAKRGRRKQIDLEGLEE